RRAADDLLGRFGLAVIQDMVQALRNERVVCASLALPWSAALENAGFVDDLRHIFFLAVGHYMDASDTLDVLDFVDDVDAKALAFGLLVDRAFEARDDGVGDMDARYVAADPARRLGRGQRSDADQNEALFV